MKTKEKFFGNRYIMILFNVVFFALFAYAAYSFYWEYLRWNNMLNVALNEILQVAGFALLCWFSLELSEKEYTKSSIFFRLAAALAVFEALQWGLPWLINTAYGQGKENTLATGLTTLVLLTVYSIVNIMYWRNLINKFGFKRGAMKIISVVLCVVMCGGYIGAGVNNALATHINFFIFYPVYRLFVPQGGTPTLDSDIVYDFAYSTEKPVRTDNLGTDTEWAIKLAKNEREGFQIIFASGKKDNSIKLKVSDFVSADGNILPVSVYREGYTRVLEYGTMFSDEFADALIPIKADEATELKKDRQQAFYIETLSSADTPAGEYTAELSAINGEGETVLTSEIKATVWDFVLPEEAVMDTAFGLWGSNFYTINGAETDEEREALYKQYYDFLLEHKISAYSLPYDILDTRADAYMSDPRVSSFILPYPEDDAKLVEYYEKVTSNPVWAEKAYFYPIDEPGDAEAYAKYAEITDRLNRLCPGYNMVTPFATNSVTVDGKECSAVELQDKKSSILCGLSSIFDQEGFSEDMYASRDNNNSRLWWYVCCGPTGDYNNFFIHLDAIQHRVLMWQEKQLDVTGLLYWDTAYWDKANPWESSKTWDSHEAAGDGCLLYPGAYIGINEPIGSLRLVNITDGLDDYDYLTLAEKEFGREWIDEKAAQISTSLTEYTKDYALLEQIRCEIGEALAEK